MLVPSQVPLERLVLWVIQAAPDLPAPCPSSRNRPWPEAGGLGLVAGEGLGWKMPASLQAVEVRGGCR